MNLSDRINVISDDVFGMEQEIERLKAQLQIQQEPDVRDILIDLVAPDIEWWEEHMPIKSEKKRKIVDAYRVCRPKGKE